MSTSINDEELCRTSERLYTIVNWIIGHESQVRSRRQQYDLSSIFVSFTLDKSWKFIMSGSRGEGLDFISSDFDIMALDENILVIDHELRNLSKNSRFPMSFLMETDNVQEGFTLLKCIRYDSRVQGNHIYNTLCLTGDGVYMSSQRAQEIKLIPGKSSVHGPCRSGIVFGAEYDCAYTLKCPFWPKSAESFVHRSVRNKWPSTLKLIDICKDGVLLVPISSKHRSLSNNADLEWRISFSLAEKKLIYSLNHCQFLCYGLMKIFLDEVLKELPETKTETGNVLCSYFMKTAVFWEISECGNDWSDRNFLNKFLNVFRRLIKWIEQGYCPNFFIPEHNMFYGKIYGRRQRELLLRLRLLYDEGFLCLYRCSLLGSRLSTIMNEQFPFHLFQVRSVDILAFLNAKEIIQMMIAAHSAPKLSYYVSVLKKELLDTSALMPTSDEMSSVIKLRINHILQGMALILAIRGFQNITTNKLQYLCTKTARSILRKTKTSLYVDSIFQAVISYMNGEYYKTIQIVNNIQQRLQTYPYMYRYDMNPGIIMGCRRQGMSYEDIVKWFVIDLYEYDPVISIPNLILEFYVRIQDCPSPIIYIPPLVFLLFLAILSYTRLNKPIERKDLLSILHSLLYHDNDNHIHYSMTAISWEILGICQQLCGDYVGAYQSYLNALNDEYNEFKEATIIRIQSLLFQ